MDFLHHCYDLLKIYLGKAKGKQENQEATLAFSVLSMAHGTIPQSLGLCCPHVDLGSGILQGRKGASLRSRWTSIPSLQNIQILEDLMGWACTQEQYVCIKKQIIPGSFGDSSFIFYLYLLRSISMTQYACTLIF